MDEQKKYAKVYIKPDGSVFQMKLIFKMVKKFRSMNWIEQQTFLSTIQKDVLPKPSKEHTYHHFISKRGKPHNTVTDK